MWQGCTFAAACGDEVPEGECHPFCLECVYYSGFQPCCVDSHPLCKFGRMMSPTAIALRMMDRVGILQRYSSGQPRVQRFPLQLTRAPTPRPDVPTPDTTPQAIPIPQQAIVDVCKNVVRNPQSFQDEPQPGNSRTKSKIRMPPSMMDDQETVDYLPQPEQQVLPQQATPRYETRQQKARQTLNSTMSTTSRRPREPPATATTSQSRYEEVFTAPDQPITSQRSDTTETMSIDPALNQSQVQRVSHWAEQQRKTVRVRNPTPQHDISILGSTAARVTTASSTTSECIWVDDRDDSPTTVFFPREKLKSTIYRNNVHKYRDAVQCIEQLYPQVLKPLGSGPKPASKNSKTVQLGGTYAALVDEYILALAEDMRQAGVKDLNHFPPVKPQGALRGPFTLQQPVLHITAQMFPDPDVTPWCVKNPCPSLLTKMTHYETASLEERIVLAISSANFAIHCLTVSHKHNTIQKTKKIKQDAGHMLGISIQAMHANYANVVAVRRRDVIDPILAINRQLDILRQPVSITKSLVE